eukprot:GHVN01027247.1.p1 GENE.GHVN01027247.1~~GHVN01027247.1.p1  ORF type:complete len:1260 (-),score=245.17 GHVN01027247.1:637-4416(-)
MSFIDKLAIKGIRSFSPQTQNAIVFGTPLTIILGQNGVGKTTIIECLKYVTTGEFPPATRGGGGFVHDPKLAGEAEVQAMVKMKFKNIEGEDLIVTRTLGVTQKKVKTEFKTLDRLLQRIDKNTGEKITISAKQSELDLAMEANLGVSKALLENVIFCHQEDAAWPLADSSTLKKKFDEIFSATKYIKTIELLKKIRKEKMQGLKLELQQLDFLKTEKERAERLFASQEEISEKIREKKETIDSLGPQITRLDELIAEKQALLEAFSKIETEIEVIEYERGHLLKQKEELGEFSLCIGEDGELNKRLLDIQQGLNKLETRKNVINQERMVLGEQIEKMAEKGAALKEENAGHRMELQLRKGQLENKRIRLEEIKERHHIVGEEASQVLARLEALGEEKRKALDDLYLKEAKRESLKEIQDLLNKEAVERSNLERTEKEIKAKRERRAELENGLLAETTGKEEIQEAWHVLQKKEKLQERKEAQKEIKKEKEVLECAERKTEEIVLDLNRKLVQTKEKNEIHMRISIKNSEVEQRRLLLEVEKSNETGSMESCESKKKCLEEELQKLALKNSGQEKALLILCEQIKTLEAELNDSSEKAKGELALSDAEAKQLEEKGIEETGRVLKELYGRFLSSLKEAEKCPICMRGFEADEDKNRLVSLLTEEIKKHALREREEFEQAAEFEETVSALQKKRRIVLERRHHTNVVIPRLVERLKCENEALRRGQEEYNKTVLQIEEKEKERKRLHEALERIRSQKRIQMEIENLSRECEELALLLGEGSFLQEDIFGALEREQLERDKIRNQKKRISALEGETEELIQRETREIEEAQEIQRRNEERKYKEEMEKMEIKNLKREIERAEKERIEMVQMLEYLKEEIKAKTQEAEDERQKLAQDEKDTRKKIAEIESGLFHCKEFIGEIGQFDAQRLENMLKEREHMIRELEDRISGEKEQQRRGEELLEQLESSRMELVGEAQNIQNTLRYRDIERKSKTLDERATDLARKHGADAGSLQDKREKMAHFKRKRDELGVEQTGLVGELRQLELQKQRLEHELDVEYGGISEKHAQQYYRAFISQVEVGDLERVENEMDAAIMQYHKVKMEEINLIIKELWTNTYRGSDIDFIRIKTEKTGCGGKTYNYCVEMVRGGVEMDMRGRSSTGQRALASLIIRLSLAEAFGVNCGVFALDEPTTNLDRENIDGLVESLVRIVESRQRQRNFQFVLITHDEEFFRKMAQVECAGEYWRIFKDERNASMVERCHMR